MSGSISLLFYNRKALLLGLCISLLACSSHIPPEISQALPAEIDLENVYGKVEEHSGKQVRWGGIILNTENHADTTWLTVIAKPLLNTGRPGTNDHSPGRFIAIVPGFLEPNVYKAEREITFIGTLIRSQTKQVGMFDYHYPVIEVSQHFLWSKPLPVDPVISPFRYSDPWYDPFYPHNHLLYPYPYFR